MTLTIERLESLKMHEVTLADLQGQQDLASGKAAAHYGVLGMKWGVRKDIRMKKAQAKARAKRPSTDRARITKLANKPASTLSNKQLKEVNNRLQMEQTLAQMKSKQSRISRGQAKIAAVLAVAGTVTTVYNMVNSPAGKAGILAVKRAIGAYNIASGRRLMITDGK